MPPRPRHPQAVACLGGTSLTAAFAFLLARWLYSSERLAVSG